jgi:hypothetical protein
MLWLLGTAVFVPNWRERDFFGALLSFWLTFGGVGSPKWLFAGLYMTLLVEVRASKLFRKKWETEEKA